MVFESLGVTDRGLRRHHNEDQFLIRDDLTLYVVADGMGGHAAGEVAADLAVREVERVVEATRDYEDATWPNDWDPRLTLNANRLVRAIVSAHRRVTGAVDVDTGLRGTGATIVAALLDNDEGQPTVAHVGDSRAYLYHNNASELITSDHSWVREQVVAGLLSEEAARWGGIAPPALPVSTLTSSQARRRNPAPSITARISSGGRRKLAAASRAHMSGKTGGPPGPAMGS